MYSLLIGKTGVNMLVIRRFMVLVAVATFVGCGSKTSNKSNSPENKNRENKEDNRADEDSDALEGKKVFLTYGYFDTGVVYNTPPNSEGVYTVQESRNRVMTDSFETWRNEISSVFSNDQMEILKLSNGVEASSFVGTALSVYIESDPSIYHKRFGKLSSEEIFTIARGDIFFQSLLGIESEKSTWKESINVRNDSDASVSGSILRVGLQLTVGEKTLFFPGNLVAKHRI